MSASPEFSALPSSRVASFARASRRRRASSCFRRSASIRSSFSRWARIAYALARSISPPSLPPARGPRPLPFGRPFDGRPPSLPAPARAPSLPGRPPGFRSGLAGLKPSPSSWSRNVSLISSSVVRRRRFVGRIGVEAAARLLQFFQRALEQHGVARRLLAERRQRVAELGHRLLLEREPGLQLHHARFQLAHAAASPGLLVRRLDVDQLDVEHQ